MSPKETYMRLSGTHSGEVSRNYPSASQIGLTSTSREHLSVQSSVLLTDGTAASMSESAPRKPGRAVSARIRFPKRQTKTPYWQRLASAARRADRPRVRWVYSRKRYAHAGHRQAQSAQRKGPHGSHAALWPVTQLCLTTAAVCGRHSFKIKIPTLVAECGLTPVRGRRGAIGCTSALVRIPTATAEVIHRFRAPTTGPYYRYYRRISESLVPQWIQSFVVTVYA